MRKIFISSVVILLIFIIYLTTIDKKVYYLTLGDELSVSTDEIVSFSDKVVRYLSDNEKLEIFVNDFSKDNYNINDVIDDIKENKKVNY